MHTALESRLLLIERKKLASLACTLATVLGYMGIGSRRLRRTRLLPLLVYLLVAILTLFELSGKNSPRDSSEDHPDAKALLDQPPDTLEFTNANQYVPQISPDTPIAVLPDYSVLRGQAFFYTYPESNRLGSFETWRPKELLSRTTMQNKEQSEDNIFAVVQTSPRTTWRYLPVLLLTVLQELPHFGVYSQTADAVRDTEVVDAIASLDPDFIAHSPYMEPYRVMRIVRDSHVNVALDEISVVGAQSLARFVTLPMLHHAYTQHSEHDWYVIILDTTYIFNENLRAVLAALDPSEAFYLGSAVKGPEYVYADIGSGIVLSRETMRRAFGGNLDSIRQYSERAATEYSGDYILAMYLKEQHGIELNISLSSGQFQGNPTNRVPVSAKNWCTRIVSANQQHPRELDTLAEYTILKRGQPILYSDIYFDFIKPYLLAGSQQNWDNKALDLEFGPGYNIETEAHKSLEACREACIQLPQCLMFRHDAYRQYCGLGISTVSLGGPIIRYDTQANDEICQSHGIQCEPRRSDEPTTSEWLIHRVRAMRQTMACDPLSVDANDEGTEYGALDQVEGWWHRARRLAKDSDPLRNL